MGAPHMVNRLLVVTIWMVVAAGHVGAEMRTWTSRTGAQVEAEWVGEQGGKAMLRKADGKTVGIALASLSDADQTYVRSLRAPVAPITPGPAPVPAAAPAANRMSLGGVDVVKGDATSFLAPLPEDAIKALKKEDNTEIAEARVAVAVPENFDPARTWKVLVVSATSDANSQSIGHMHQFKKEALARGWVLMAADPPNAEAPKDCNNTWRWSLIRAGLDEMHRAWPGSRAWSYATAGFSGGAKRSGYIAALLAEADYHVIGMYMGGCNQDMASLGLKEFGPKRSAFLKVPIFLSNGDRDATAPVSSGVRVKNSMDATGFKHLRMETYPGGHDLYPAHTDTALAWFEELAAAP